MYVYISAFTLTNILRNKEGLPTVWNKANLNSFVKLSLNLWSLYRYDKKKDNSNLYNLYNSSTFFLNLVKEIAMNH